MTDTYISRLYEMTERTKNMATEAERAVDLARGIWIDADDLILSSDISEDQKCILKYILRIAAEIVVLFDGLNFYLNKRNPYGSHD